MRPSNLPHYPNGKQLMKRPSTGIIWPTHKAKAQNRRRLRKNPTRYTSTRTESN